MLKLTKDMVKTRILEYNYILLGEYVDTHTHMHVKCLYCGTEHQLSLRHITDSDSNHCKACRSNAILTTVQVAGIVKNFGFTLLSEYQNAKTKVLVRCSCGAVSSMLTGNIRAGKKCIFCAQDRSIAKLRCFSDTDIEVMLQAKDMLLLSYRGMGNLMVYQCHCGRIDTRMGDRASIARLEKCRHCKEDCVDRSNWRKVKEYHSWRRAVLEEDNFSCLKCGELATHAHHIQSPVTTELKYDPTNGGTLCEDCHIIYHSMYGIVNCNNVDFNKYIGRF